MQIQYIGDVTMKVRVVKMRKAGVAVERRMLYSPYTIKHDGWLVIMDVTD